MVEKALGDEDAAIVLALVSSLYNDVTNTIDDIDESLTSRGGLLRYDDKVRVSLHGAL